MGKRDRIKRSPSHSNSKIKLSIKELKEFVDATSNAIADDEVEGSNDENKVIFSSVGTHWNEDSAEGSLEDDQVETFSDIQDSCELVKARRVKDADAALETPIVAAVQDPMGTDLTHNPSNPSWFTEMQARMLAIKNNSNLSPFKNNETSHFENFLTEVLQTERNGGHISNSKSGTLNCEVKAPMIDAHVQAIQSPAHKDSGLFLDVDPSSAGVEFPKVFCGPSNGNICHRNVGYTQAGFGMKPIQPLAMCHEYSCSAQSPDLGSVDTQQIGSKHDRTGHYCVGPSTIHTQGNPDKPSARVMFGQELEPPGHVSAFPTTSSNSCIGLNDSVGPTDLMVDQHHHFAEKNSYILTRHHEDCIQFQSALNAQAFNVNTQPSLAPNDHISAVGHYACQATQTSGSPQIGQMAGASCLGQTCPVEPTSGLVTTVGAQTEHTAQDSSDNFLAHSVAGGGQPSYHPVSTNLEGTLTVHPHPIGPPLAGSSTQASNASSSLGKLPVQAGYSQPAPDIWLSQKIY